MTVYSIFEKPQGKAAKDRAPVAIPERFSWFAMLLPPVFALVHGLWLLLLFWIALVLGLAYAGRVIGPEAVFWLYVVGGRVPRFRDAGAAARLAAVPRLSMAGRHHRPGGGSGPARLSEPQKMTASVAIIDYGSGNLPLGREGLRALGQGRCAPIPKSPSPPIPISSAAPTASSCRASAPSRTA